MTNPELTVTEISGGRGRVFRMIRHSTAAISFGSYEVLENGFLPIGCRKPLASETAAQAKLIQRYIDRLTKDIQIAKAIMDGLK